MQQLTENRDLRGGRSCWLATDGNTMRPDTLPSYDIDIAIVGAGVMGAMLADRLTAQGRRVVLLWREDALIWEASSPYLYARATADGRVIAGGEDEDFVDAARRRRQSVFRCVGEPQLR